MVTTRGWEEPKASINPVDSRQGLCQREAMSGWRRQILRVPQLADWAVPDLCSWPNLRQRPRWRSTKDHSRAMFSTGVRSSRQFAAREMRDPPRILANYLVKGERERERERRAHFAWWPFLLVCRCVCAWRFGDPIPRRCLVFAFPVCALQRAPPSVSVAQVSCFSLISCFTAILPVSFTIFTHTLSFWDLSLSLSLISRSRAQP